jgi:hypothetical protein
VEAGQESTELIGPLAELITPIRAAHERPSPSVRADPGTARATRWSVRGMVVHSEPPRRELERVLAGDG